MTGPMAELQFSSVPEPRNVVGDWAIRSGIAVCFIAFGLEKFSSDPGGHWTRMFHEIGWGDWFRYFTGVVETLGGVLVLIPRLALVGLAMLAVTMAGAMAIVAVVLKRPGESVFPGVFFAALVGVAIWVRHNR